ncbi:MAG: protein phosphatase 2C domain-containing protein [Clostridia bacterium]|nr:protein phosphatase 2C domain-containing protein [Clostridia bacterium]
MKLFCEKNNYWICYGKANIGKSHITNNIPCQDKISYCCNKHGLIAVLCDGLGSKENADIGAEFVSFAVKKILDKYFFEMFQLEETKIAEFLLKHLIEDLHKNSQICEYEIDSLKTTLMFLAIKKDHYILGHIGDGVLTLLDNDKIAYYSTIKKNTQELEYANTTFTVFDYDAKEHFTIKKGTITNSFNSGILISDGLPFLANSNKIAPKVISYLDLMKTSDFSFIDKEINDNILRIINSKEIYTDDWSYIFIANCSRKKAKSFFDNR